jgi:nucleotide-binding universal stress UspA family protein
MSPDEQPAVVAYDGSEEAQAAVREAARLLPGRRLVVVSVWEQGLALMLMPPTDTISGVPNMTPSPETIATTDRAQHDHAADTAAQGAEIARSLGADAEPYPVADDDVDAAETIAAEAERLDAAVIVIGSRGLGRMKSRLLGSTSQGLLRHTRRPVIVVKAPE